MAADSRRKKNNEMTGELFHVAPYLIVLAASIVIILVHKLLPEHISVSDVILMVGAVVLAFFLLMLRVVWALSKKMDGLLRMPHLQELVEELEKKMRDLEASIAESRRASELLPFHELIAVEASVPRNTEVWILAPSFDGDHTEEFARVMRENIEEKNVTYRFFIHPNSKGDYEQFRKNLRINLGYNEKICAYFIDCVDDLFIWETTLYNATSETKRAAYVGAFSEVCYAQRTGDVRATALFRELNKVRARKPLDIL